MSLTILVATPVGDLFGFLLRPSFASVRSSVLDRKVGHTSNRKTTSSDILASVAMPALSLADLTSQVALQPQGPAEPQHAPPTRAPPAVNTTEDHTPPAFTDATLKQAGSLVVYAGLLYRRVQVES